MAQFFPGRDRNAPTRPVATITRTMEEIQEFLRLLPRYRVLLHNDDEHTMDEVVLALQRTLPDLGVDQAWRIMLDAHEHGVGEVIVCLKEQAEHYQARLRGFTLTSTIEPA